MSFIEKSSVNVHDMYKDRDIDSLMRISKALTMPYSIMLYNCCGDFNIGVLARTGTCLATHRVFTVGRRKFDRRTLVGANNYTQLEKYDEITDLNAFFSERKMFPVFIEQGGVDIDTYKFEELYSDPSREPCLVVGSECDGIPQKIMDAFPDSPRLSISQPGVIRSLNVSSAGSMALHRMYCAQKRLVSDRYGLI